VINWQTIFLFDGWKVRGWSRCFCEFAHVLNSFNEMKQLSRHTKDS
jgi:hypothetical protein